MKKILILFLLIGFLATTQAQMSVGNYSIQKNYAYGDTLSGWINLSFKDEPLNSTFKDTEGNIISLEKFLNVSNHKYNCSTKNCLADFTTSAAATNKQIVLNENGSIVYGFSFTGNIVEIYSIEFTIQSNAPPSEKNQLKIDFLDDGIIDAGNTRPSVQTSNIINTGCYNKSWEGISSLVEISQTPYCQLINLSEAPGFKIGAWIKKDSSSTNSIKLEVYNFDTAYIGNCEIPNNLISTTGSYVECDLNFFVSSNQPHYICLSKNSGNSNFETKLYEKVPSNERCAFYGNPPRDFDNGAYYIGARSKNFDSFGTIKISNELPNTQKLSYLFEEYIIQKYGSLDCTNTCNVPFKLISEINSQSITVSYPIVKYSTSSAASKTENLIYTLLKEPSKISSDYQKTYLDGIFKLRNLTKSRDYILRFMDKKIIDEEDIETKNIYFTLTPKSTVSNYPTEFVFETDINESITEYFWDFGDGKNITTQKNNTIYSYAEIGNYTLILTAKKFGGGEIKRTYEIIVTSPKNLIESKINSMKQSITQLKTQYSKLSNEEKVIFNQKLNLEGKEAELKSLETKYSTSTTEEEYKLILPELLKINVPNSAIIVSSPEIPFFTKNEYIYANEIRNLDPSIKIDSSNEEIKNSVLYWTAQNMEVKVSMNEILLIYSDREESLLKKYSVTMNPKNPSTEYYIFYNKYLLTPLGIIPTKELADVSYLKKSSNSKIDFITNQNIELIDLPVMISPSVNQLILIEQIPESIPQKRAWKIFLSIVFILLFAFVAYMLLKKWYKTKYEKYLFSDRNNLYNVMIYVNNSKKQGLDNGEIKQNLSRAGWTGEQIRYILRKFENKSTGMPEFNLKQKTTELSQIKKEKTPVKNAQNTQTLINKKHIK